MIRRNLNLNIWNYSNTILNISSEKSLNPKKWKPFVTRKSSDQFDIFSALPLHTRSKEKRKYKCENESESEGKKKKR